MEKDPNPVNSEGSEVMYKNSGLLVDYGNEYGPSKVGIDENGNIYRDSFVRTVEERFSIKSRQHSQGRIDEAKTVPHKVERINRVANILNTTSDVVMFKRAINEMNRLIYGTDTVKMGKKVKRDLTYPEPEFNPDLLEI